LLAAQEAARIEKGRKDQKEATLKRELATIAQLPPGRAIPIAVDPKVVSCSVM